MIRRDQLPPGDFRDSFTASGGFYVDLLSSKEGPESVKDVVVFALSLAMADAARAASSLEKRLGVNEVSAPEAPATTDPLDQLKKLSKLHDLGVLSAEEFESKKAELLDRI
ncbi:MAG: SHOCT domain-containing protein [Gemmatimonadales bacterium]|nr:SHOCT domain-containing protein [Gemmatimonadales bacterium]